MFSNGTAESHRWIIGITGASGTVYARKLVAALIDHVPQISLEVVISDAAFRVMREEENVLVPARSLTAKGLFGRDSAAVTFHNNRDIGASIASGSYPVRGMVIAPCSMGTLAAISAGLGDNLIRRAADVTLKESRPLLLVPRETPLSSIHLENMLALSRCGARIIPAMPGFYHLPATIDELTDLLVMKIGDQMGYSLPLAGRWKAEEPDRRPEKRLQAV
jgi:4-hydroxy-3-polyprenylbenzoate decarboxylase